MHYRWRTNPTVIAQYLNDSDIPRQAEVTLKPNEVCVILENGKIVGSVSQTHMEVNPDVGLFGKIFGRNAPSRSFLFAFTGPHPVMVHVEGVAENGDEIDCLLTVKVEITRESAPRLITFPAGGHMAVEAHQISSVIQQLTRTCVLEVLRTKDADGMRTVETSEDISFELRNRLRSLLDSHGLVFRGSYVTWSASAAEQQMKNQHKLQRIRMNHDFDSEQERIKLDAFIAAEHRKAELDAMLALSNVNAEESAAMALELKRLDSVGKIDLKKWEQDNSLEEMKAEAARASSIKDAQHKNELAKLEVERQRIMAAPVIEIKEQKAQRDRDAQAQKTAEAERLFKLVQSRKQERMALKKEAEEMRLEKQLKGSEKTISVLENIAATSDDAEVKLEALKQLAELRKSDLQAQKDAYKNE